MSDKRYELALYVGPCSEDAAEALAVAITALKEARTAGAGAVSIAPVADADPLFADAVGDAKEPGVDYSTDEKRRGR